MIGNRTFPSRNKTQIIKKTQTIADEFAFYCISCKCVYCIYYEKMEGMEFPVTTR